MGKVIRKVKCPYCKQKVNAIVNLDKKGDKSGWRDYTCPKCKKNWMYA